jgi:hypothetical protein
MLNVGLERRRKMAQEVDVHCHPVSKSFFDFGNQHGDLRPLV